MKKSHPFNVLSDVKCIDASCHNKIKLRFIEEKRKPRWCFSCHKKNERARGHQMK